MNSTNSTSGGIFINSPGAGAVNYNTVNAQTAGNVELRAVSAATLTDIDAANGTITASVTEGLQNLEREHVKQCPRSSLRAS